MDIIRYFRVITLTMLVRQQAGTFMKHKFSNKTKASLKVLQELRDQELNEPSKKESVNRV